MSATARVRDGVWHALMVERARELAAKGNLTARQIAERTGLTVGTVAHILSRLGMSTA